MKNTFLLLGVVVVLSINLIAQEPENNERGVEVLEKPRIESPLPGTLNTFDTISRTVTPAEVLSVLIESEYLYTLNAISDTSTAEVYLRSYDSLEVIDPLVYYDSETGLNMMLYESSVARKIFEKAEKAFMSFEMVDARNSYRKVLELDPTAYICSLYIAQTYKHDGNYQEYEKRLDEYMSAYPKDALAMRFKGLDLYEKEEYEESLDYMIHSTILNRNNPLNTLSFNKALSGMDMRYDDSWEFIPKFQIDSTKPKEIFVSAIPEWSVVAMMDMVYEFDPAAKRRAYYRGDLGRERQAIMIAALVTAADEGDELEDHPDKALATLYEAIDNETQIGYFLYEVLLPRYPYYGFILSDEEKEEIREYLVDHRFVEIEDEDE